MQDAKAMLQLLCKTHIIISSVSFKYEAKNINHIFNEQLKLRLGNPYEYVTTYINSSSPYDKVRKHGIQDWSAIL